MKREKGKWYIKIHGEWVDLMNPDFRKAKDELEYQILKREELHFACRVAWCANGGER